MEWTTPPDLFADVLEQDFERKYRGLIINIGNHLVALSPVDTGRYKNNHHTSFNTPSYAVFGENGGHGIQLPPQGTFPTVYIQNNLSYALRLEQGHSGQAPTGVYQNAFNHAIGSFS